MDAVVVERHSFRVALLVVPAYILVGSMAGIIAHRIALMVILPRRRARPERDGFFEKYQSQAPEIKRLHKKYFGETRLFLKSGEQASEPEILKQEIEQLVWFMRMYDPVGYNHVYRTYVFLFLYRQLVVYLVTLLIVGGVLCLTEWFSLRLVMTWGGLAIALWVFLAGISEVTGQAAEGEFKLVASADAWLTFRRSTWQYLGNFQATYRAVR